MGRAPMTTLQCNVEREWVDYNGHMNDAAYVHVFSLAIDQILLAIGLDERTRETTHFSIYTLENHVRYLQECHEGDGVSVTAQLIDYDKKRLHFFLMMQGPTGDVLATSEQMLMGVSTDLGKSAPFPDAIAKKITERAQDDAKLERPEGIGSSISIRHR